MPNTIKEKHGIDGVASSLVYAAFGQVNDIFPALKTITFVDNSIFNKYSINRTFWRGAESR